MVNERLLYEATSKSSGGLTKQSPYRVILGDFRQVFNMQ